MGALLVASITQYREVLLTVSTAFLHTVDYPVTHTTVYSALFSVSHTTHIPSHCILYQYAAHNPIKPYPTLLLPSSLHFAFPALVWLCLVCMSFPVNSSTVIGLVPASNPSYPLPSRSPSLFSFYFFTSIVVCLLCPSPSSTTSSLSLIYFSGIYFL